MSKLSIGNIIHEVMLHKYNTPNLSKLAIHPQTLHWLDYLSVDLINHPQNNSQGCGLLGHQVMLDEYMEKNQIIGLDSLNNYLFRIKLPDLEEVNSDNT